MITWEYLAGFIDCDGWITCSKNKNSRTKRYTIGLTQSAIHTNKMKEIANFLTDHKIRNSFTYRLSNTIIGKLSNSSPMVNIQIKEQISVVEMCKNLLPFMLIKKDKLIECLTYTQGRVEKRAEGLKSCNKEKRFWDSVECLEATKLKRDGYSDKAIGIKLGRSTHSISDKLSRINRVNST